jgi:hypothetical protein
MDRRSGTIRTGPVRWQAPTAKDAHTKFRTKKKGFSFSSSPLHHAQRQRAQTSKRLHHHRPGLVGLPVDRSNESRWLWGPLKLINGYPPHQFAHLMSGAVARSVGFGCAQRQLLLTLSAPPTQTNVVLARNIEIEQYPSVCQYCTHGRIGRYHPTLMSM